MTTDDRKPAEGVILAVIIGAVMWAALASLFL